MKKKAMEPPPKAPRQQLSSSKGVGG